MIKNNKQLTVTKRQLALLSSALRKLKAGRQDAATRIEIKSLEADVAKLKQQIAEFEAAMERRIDLTSIEAVGDFGKLLVLGRIAAHMTQDELAQELGRKPQQIQRYEREEYRSASLGTLTRVASVLKESLGRPGRAKADG